MSWMSYAIFVVPDEASGAGLFSFIVVFNGVTIILYRLRGKTLGKRQEGANEGHEEIGKTAKKAGFPLGRQAAIFPGTVAGNGGDDPRVCRDRIA